MGSILNVILGLVMIVGGLGGRLALRGTQSGAGLAAVGVFRSQAPASIVAFGTIRLARRLR